MFDLQAFRATIETDSDKLTFVIKQCHTKRLKDEYITEAVRHLIEHEGYKPNGECLQKCACFGYKQLAEYLLEKGLNINTRDRNKNTPLINACHTRHAEIARFLIERGAFINARNRFGWSALNYACQNNDIEMVKFLVEHKIDTYQLSPTGRITKKMNSVNQEKYAKLIEYLKTVPVSEKPEQKKE